MTPVSLFWFRRDLRLHDNHGLHQALTSGRPVVPIFIFDSDLLDQLEDRDDRRVSFIYGALEQLQRQLRAVGSTLDVRYGKPHVIWKELLTDYRAEAVYFNHDYEPYARKRDGAILGLLKERSIELHSFKDQVIFERKEVVKDNGEPYGVFTPFSKRWKVKLKQEDLDAFRSEKNLDGFHRQPVKPLPPLESMGFSQVPIGVEARMDKGIIRSYHETRDLPAVAGTTRLGIHLRFGTVSVRECVRMALKENETFLGELIWREFFMQLLWQQPRLEREACKREYDTIQWRNNEEEFAAWCEGRTGFPLVDAGMRELNATGFMHNRVRMVAASFLVKHLLVDWRWGEAYFARKLDDYELASNNGNWQWVAGCGCDAAPYFRIFNPASQVKRFDPKGLYLRKWIPELETSAYPKPIVDHAFARQRCMEVYKKAVATRYASQPPAE